MPLYEAGEWEGRPYLAMKWVEGEHLGQWIEKARKGTGEAGSSRANGLGETAAPFPFSP